MQSQEVETDWLSLSTWDESAVGVGKHVTHFLLPRGSGTDCLQRGLGRLPENKSRGRKNTTITHDPLLQDFQEGEHGEKDFPAIVSQL